MLLFSKDPERYQPGAFLRIGYYETDADPLYQDKVYGSMIRVSDEVKELEKS